MHVARYQKELDRACFYLLGDLSRLGLDFRAPQTGFGAYRMPSALPEDPEERALVECLWHTADSLREAARLILLLPEPAGLSVKRMEKRIESWQQLAESVDRLGGLLKRIDTVYSVLRPGLPFGEQIELDQWLSEGRAALLEARQTVSLGLEEEQRELQERSRILEFERGLRHRGKGPAEIPVLPSGRAITLKVGEEKVYRSEDGTSYLVLSGHHTGPFMRRIPRTGRFALGLGTRKSYLPEFGVTLSRGEVRHTVKGEVRELSVRVDSGNLLADGKIACPRGGSKILLEPGRTYSLQLGRGRSTAVRIEGLKVFIEEEDRWVSLPLGQWQSIAGGSCRCRAKRNRGSSYFMRLEMYVS